MSRKCLTAVRGLRWLWLFTPAVGTKHEGAEDSGTGLRGFFAFFLNMILLTDVEAGLINSGDSMACAVKSTPSIMLPGLVSPCAFHGLRWVPTATATALSLSPSCTASTRWPSELCAVRAAGPAQALAPLGIHRIGASS